MTERSVAERQGLAKIKDFGSYVFLSQLSIWSIDQGQSKGEHKS